MTVSRFLRTPLFGLALAAACVTPAFANLCDVGSIDQVHRTEAVELEREGYSDGNWCAPPSSSCFIGKRDYNERVIACNRKRDADRTPAPGHVPIGRILDSRASRDRQFANNLPPRFVNGIYAFFGLAPKWYGYMLERDDGKWIATTVLDFKFPSTEKDKLHIPMYLAQRLSTQASGTPLTSTLCAGVSRDKNTNGRVRVPDSSGALFDRSCRINREQKLFLAVPDTFLPESLGETESKPATEWLMHYWRNVVSKTWSRPDGSFQMKVIVANFVGRAGEVDEDDLELLRQNDVVFEVELHHNEDRTNNMYRPIEVAGIKIYKAIYTGIPPDTVAHEFGHSLGLDDDYPQDRNYPPEQDCEKLSGFTGIGSANNNHLSYVMCSDHEGDEPQDVKSVYLWLVTQRYSVGKTLEHCKQDSQCDSNQYCKRPVLGLNRCVALKAIGDSCTADRQCRGEAAVCMPKPFGRCIVEGSKAMGQACINNPECASGMCDKGVCVCAQDGQCSNNQYCDTGTATVGANRCAPKRANDVPCTRAGQCLSDRCYLGACKPQDECNDDDDCSGNEYCDAGTVTIGVNQCVARRPNDTPCTRAGQCQSNRCHVGSCKPQDACDEDGDCAASQFCDKGTAGVGVNRCVAERPLGEACSRGGQCASNCCKLYEFKVQCRPTDKCN